MTVWGLQFSIAVVLFFLTFPIALLFLTYHHYHRHGTFRGWSAALTIVTFMYVVGVVAFTLFPFPSNGTSNCIAGEARIHAQLIPFASLTDIFDVWRSVGFPGVLTSATFLQVLLNVVLLIPLGMLLAYRYKRSIGVTVLAGLGVSLLIEITQGTAVFGTFDCPYRLADVDDLITNTAGAAIGWMIAMALMRWLPEAAPAPDPDLDPPRIVRRVFAGVLDILALLLVGVVVRFVALTVSATSGDVPQASGGASMTLLDTVAVVLLLFLAVPMLRRDRATPGQIVTWLANVDVSSMRRAAPSQVVIRFAVRWLPIAVGSFVQPLAAIAIVAIYEMIAMTVRSDHRSLSATLAGTTTVTRRRLESDTGTAPDRSARS